MSKPSEFTTPELGQLHLRKVPQGFILVGLLHFDPSVEIEEEAAYVAVLDAGRVYISRQKVDGPLDRDHAWSVGDVLTQEVWRQTTDARALVVRFIKAFPDDNGWTVFGPSLHPMPTPNDHHWWDVGSGGRLTVSDGPDTAGFAIGQVLNSLPLWRNRDGVEHVLHTGPSWTGPLYDRAHRLMALSETSDALRNNLKDLLRSDPQLKKIYANTDRMFCQSLNAEGYHLSPEVDYTTVVYGVMTKDAYEKSNQEMKESIVAIHSNDYKPKGFSV